MYLNHSTEVGSDASYHSFKNNTYLDGDQFATYLWTRNDRGGVWGLGGRWRREDWLGEREATTANEAGKEGMGSGSSPQCDAICSMGDKWTSGDRLVAFAAVVDMVVRRVDRAGREV